MLLLGALRLAQRVERRRARRDRRVLPGDGRQEEEEQEVAGGVPGGRRHGDDLSSNCQGGPLGCRLIAVQIWLLRRRQVSETTVKYLPATSPLTTTTPMEPCAVPENPWKTDCACVSRRGNGIMASRNRHGSRMKEANMLVLLLLVWLLPALEALKVSPLIEKVSEHKDFKKLLRTRTNVLVVYTKTATSGDSQLKLLSDVAQTVKGQGTIAWVNCGDSEGRKLCKKLKVDPSSRPGGAELLHYKDGTFHTEYNRPATFKSMVAFLKDPSGPPLWEENPEAKDVVHVETEKDFRKLLKREERPVLFMFYAPWCGVCKRMQPVFQQAATETKGRFVLAGMNVHPAEFDGLKQEYGVKGYPTFVYFEKGKFLYHYENYGATAKDIADWMKNPQPPQPKTPEVPWTETDSPVFHLTDESFDSFLEEHPAALVMFYAPWCGHCKKMKPEYDEAAEILNKGAESPGVLAAVDTTVHKAVGDRFKISGFPTVKYFEKGEDKYTLPHLRNKDKIIEFMHNPQAPPPPEQSWEEKPSSVSHLGSEDFREALKKKKHALVMFYAPWCPHCKNAVPHFSTAAELFREDRKIVYAAVDCTKGQNHDLCKQEGVEGYPTFNHYNYGKFVEKYNGDRGESGFVGFMRSLRGRDQEKVVKKKEEL